MTFGSIATQSGKDLSLQNSTTTEAGKEFLPYSRPDIGQDEIDAVARVMAGGWITTGPEAAAFEHDFGTYLCGAVNAVTVNAVAVNSATAGLHLALEALGVGPGDEVIVPTMTFTASAEVVRYLGADPVFVDCDPTTLNIDADAVAHAISSRTKMIIVVHYGGLACDMDAILTLAARHDLRVVEDAAHAFPTTYRKALVGTLASDATVFSFYANKTITTGEGGMVVTRHSDCAERMRIMRLHGIDRDSFGRFQSRVPAWRYEVVAPGFKYNLTDVAAAMGRVQLRRIDQFAERRNQLADLYFRAFEGLPLILPARARPGDNHAWHIFPVRHFDGVRDPTWRDRFINGLAKDGIGTSVHYIPLHRQPYWRDRYGLQSANFPNSEAAFSSLVSLPLYTMMTDQDAERVAASVRRHAAE